MYSEISKFDSSQDKPHARFIILYYCGFVYSRYLGSNKFTTLKNGMFPEINKIKFLKMSKNPITSIESRAFENLRNLIVL